MYATIEARVVNGVITPNESCRLPSQGRALIVLFPEEEKHAKWSSVRKDAGWLTLHEDPVIWQRRVRDDWKGRL